MTESLAGPPRASGVATYDYSLFGDVEVAPFSKIRKAIAERTSASWSSVPQVTQYDMIDITALEKRRAALSAEKKTKLTLLPLIMKASVEALKDHPPLNASLDPSGDALILKKYYNIGFAVDTPIGLLVPVVHNADRLDLTGLSSRLLELAEKARSGRLAFADAEGGSFTVTSLGRLGGYGFSPIVNAPEVAVLGIGRAEDQAVVRNGEIVVRLMLPVSLTYDHRVVDGAQGGRFLETFQDRLSDLAKEDTVEVRVRCTARFSPSATALMQTGMARPSTDRRPCQSSVLNPQCQIVSAKSKGKCRAAMK